MPTLALISASEAIDPPVERTRKLLEVKRELKAVSTAISNAKTKAKMLTEHPEEAKSFVCMILRDYPYLDSLKIIQMVDYCSMWLSNDISGYV